MKKIVTVAACLIFLVAQTEVAAQKESPRGDSSKNSMEQAREKPVGGKASKPGSTEYQKSKKYMDERAAVDRKYAQKRQEILQDTRNRTRGK